MSPSTIDACFRCRRIDALNAAGLCPACLAKAPPRCAECLRLNRLCGQHQPALDGALAASLRVQP